MSLPPDSPWRGCAANFPQPLNEEDVAAAQYLVETVYYFNTHVIRPPLVDIIYRDSESNQDVCRHVFRWDTTTYQQVFANGFEARREEGTPDDVYFDLYHYVRHSGRPLDSSGFTTHAFLSTTLDSGWSPTPAEDTIPSEGLPVYRYEIYAPGGIWVAETLGNDNPFSAQHEVCFVAGIAPQYIRSAQLFIATHEAGSSYVTWSRADDILIYNEYFSPQSHPPASLRILRPVVDCIENGARRRLTVTRYSPSLLDLPPSKLERKREKRQVSDDTADWYADEVANAPAAAYVDAAFRSSRTNEADLFMKNEYVRLSYVPGTTDDKILNGPLLICDGFPSLIATAFGEHAIDSAFDTDGDEAFIFSSNLCAYIKNAPGTLNDKILKGPMTITAMFPFFKDTVFENSIDAAFKSSRKSEAYLFKGNLYARINYESMNLIANQEITKGFNSLTDTIFESGIDAAFASHRTDEAYIFKGDQYTRINFAPGTTDDYIIGGVKPILPNWPSLASILPRDNRGLDTHDHHNQPDEDEDHVHDEP